MKINFPEKIELIYLMNEVDGNSSLFIKVVYYLRSYYTM